MTPAINQNSEPDIFLLVKELSSDEKAYYKKMAKRHANQNNALHLKLFALVEKGPITDQNELAHRLKVPNKSQFSALKTYLCKDILDTLVFQKRNCSTDTRLYFMLEQMKILHEGRFTKLAEKVCEKGIAEAKCLEKYALLIQILNLRLKITECSNWKKYKKYKDAWFTELQEVLNFLIQFEKNRLLYERTRSLTYRSWLPISSDECVEISEIKSDLQNLPRTDSPLITLYYLNTLAMCEYMLHEGKACIETGKKMFCLWQQNVQLIHENPSLFLNSLNTTCYNNFFCNRLDSAAENLYQYEKLKNKHLGIISSLRHFEIIQFNTELKIAVKKGKVNEIKHILETRAESILALCSRILVAADRLSIQCTICIAWFLLEDWNKAESLLLEVKEQNTEINRQDVLYFSLLFHLIILFEKKEWYQLHVSIKAAYLLLYSRKKLRKFEHQLMLFLGRFSNKSLRENDNSFIAQFLEEMKKADYQPKESSYLRYFNYYGWLESKLLHVRYLDYVKSRSNNS